MVKLDYPEAQFPLAVPPLFVHSLEVKQVPLRTVLRLECLYFVKVNYERGSPNEKNNLAALISKF